MKIFFSIRNTDCYSFISAEREESLIGFDFISLLSSHFSKYKVKYSEMILIVYSMIWN